MGFLELAADRYSVRTFSDRLIGPEKMEKILKAGQLGIGSVWVRGVDSRKVAKTFGLPGHIKPICLLPVGYPSEDSVPYEEWHDSFRPLDEMVEEL